jgi:predicted ester cyclase
MSTEANKAIMRRFVEVWNTDNVDLIDEVVAADCVLPNLGVRGAEALKQGVTAFRTTFPDTHLTVEDAIAEGDKVVVRISGSGTHLAELAGIEPTGKKVTWTAIAIGRCVDGKLVEVWSNEDALGRLRQLGAIPPL